MEVTVMHVQAKERQGRLATTGSRGGRNVARSTPGFQTGPPEPWETNFQLREPPSSWVQSQ